MYVSLSFFNFFLSLTPIWRSLRRWYIPWVPYHNNVNNHLLRRVRKGGGGRRLSQVVFLVYASKVLRPHVSIETQAAWLLPMRRCLLMVMPVFYLVLRRLIARFLDSIQSLPWERRRWRKMERCREKYVLVLPYCIKGIVTTTITRSPFTGIWF